MTTIHLVSSGKGNVGKSAFASVLAHLGDQAGAEPSLIDADFQRQTFHRYLGDRVLTVILSDDPDLESQPDLIWYQAEKEKRDVIVDLGAQTDIILNRWMEERGIYEAAKALGIKLLKWWVADLDADSLKEISELSQNVPEVSHVLVKNIEFAKPATWRGTISNSSELTKALNHNLKTIEFPRLYCKLMEQLRDARFSFQDAISDTAQAHIGMLDRSTIRRWLKRCEQNITPIYAFQPAPAMAKPSKTTANSKSA